MNRLYAARFAADGTRRPIMLQPTLETERLVLRPLRPGDVVRFLALAGDWHVARMTSDIPHPLTPEQAKAWLEAGGDDVRFAIEQAGEMIGSVGYFRRRTGTAELGFWLGRDYWGVGFGTEAARAVIRHGFLAGFATFSSSHFVDNPASAKLLAKLGFEPTGRGRIWCSARGIEVDAVALRLSRARAEQVLGPLQAIGDERPAWGSFLSRWLPGAAR